MDTDHGCVYAYVTMLYKCTCMDAYYLALSYPVINCIYVDTCV